MTKGTDTKLAILKAGLDMASQVGLESVTIGSLAKATSMSKSGLFAHFQSKENLQIQILNYAGESFTEEVISPALQEPAGLPRIMALVNNWIDWGGQLAGGCIFVSASTEFRERPGKVRDFILLQQQDWVECLRRVATSAIRVGDFREDADCDQFAFDLYSQLLGYSFYNQLLQDSESRKRQEAALEVLLSNYT